MLTEPPAASAAASAIAGAAGTPAAPGLPRARRIALISDHASPLAAPGGIDCGGQNVYVAQLARELALSGCLVDVFTRRDAIGRKQLVHWHQGVRVINVPAGPAHYVPKEQMLPHVEAFARFVTRFARHQPAPYDIVHANFFMSGMVAQHLRQALGLPFVITFHALGQVRRLAQRAADAFPPARVRIEAALMQQADRIIAECSQDRQDMERLYGASPARIALAPCGFDPDELWPLQREAARALLGRGAARFDPARFTVLQLGRMVPRKGVDTVIDAIALLRTRHGVDAQLLVVGGDAQDRARRHDGRSDTDNHDGPESVRLQALARRLGIGEHVHFLGRKARAELRHCYGAADVFVTTPWYEPFGITPVEAMACARPVIGSEVGGIKSTVIDGATGFLVPSRDPQAVADRLATLQRDPALARAMGEAGQRRAARHYTWRTVARQVADVYAAVLAETG
ncbi:glycosyltransferase family 1 protein [Massilia forsythiae]|uniref:Glycosyltransferase family 1 protein n=1 Tax=Massilia forsythiae TaxID=2728020 RepID=A0A7Z2VXT6_9BURK|nr:glycosyltransferase [Massilia forsythiae]QJE01204.1 glycosyltransferase family 1 protein [Massilia forsythiae]